MNLDLDLGQDMHQGLGLDLNMDLGLDVSLDLDLDLHIDLEHRPGSVPLGPNFDGGGWDVLLWAGQSSSQGRRALCADPLAAVPAASLTATP